MNKLQLIDFDVIPSLKFGCCISWFWQGNQPHTWQEMGTSVCMLKWKITSDMCNNFSCIYHNFEAREKTFNASLPVELDWYVFWHSARIWRGSIDSWSILVKT